MAWTSFEAGLGSMGRMLFASLPFDVPRTFDADGGLKTLRLIRDGLAPVMILQGNF